MPDFRVIAQADPSVLPPVKRRGGGADELSERDRMRFGTFPREFTNCANDAEAIDRMFDSLAIDPYLGLHPCQVNILRVVPLAPQRQPPPRTHGRE